jgi:2'-5' RNA ligase
VGAADHARTADDAGGTVGYVGTLGPASEGGWRHKVGLTTNYAQSALLVPVPEAEAIVGAWRAAHDPSARNGVPAHITLVVPWVPPEQIKEEHLEELEDIVLHQEAFEYQLDRVCWFGQRVLWLAPSPAQPFKDLTHVLSEHFETPPWQGEFSEVVPHLTVGLAGPTQAPALEVVAEEVSHKLPIPCQAREVDVMCGDGSEWHVRHRVAFGR